MKLQEHPEIKQLSERLRTGMLEYIGPEAGSYTPKQVEVCMTIVADHLTTVERADSRAVGMRAVEQTVLALNDLNEACDDELIETGQREDLAEIICIAGHLKGFNTLEEDVTEAWREW